MDNILMKDVSPKGGYLLENTAGHWDDEFLSDDSTGGVSVQNGVTERNLGGALSAAGISAGSSGTIVTILVVALAVIIAIVGLFALAVFIDFRQQKIADQNKLTAVKRKRYPRLNLPRCRRARDGDSSNITADAELPGHSRPPLETIAEVV